jgi:hypothetical protein
MTRREKIFWLVLGAVYVVGLIALIPAHGAICKEGTKAGEEACTSYRLVPFIFIEIGKILDALGVAITALATIAIAWFTWSLRRSTDKLWDAGERQIELARETSAAQSRDTQASIKAAVDSAKAAIASNQIAVYNAEQQLMAYVFPLEVNARLQRMPRMVGAIQIIDGPVHTYSISVVLKNMGQTPTRNLVLNISGSGFTGEMPEDFNFPDSTETKTGLIGPGGTLVTPEVDFPAAELERTEENFKRYVWGWVEYEDVFFDSTPRHRTEFCFEVRSTRDPHTREIYIGFPMHNRFNAADWNSTRPFDPAENKYG